MAYRHPGAHNARVDHVVDVQHAVILNAGLMANANVVHVALDSDIGPNAGSFTDHHVADDLAAYINVGGGCDAWHHPAVRSNHGEIRLTCVACLQGQPVLSSYQEEPVMRSRSGVGV